MKCHIVLTKNDAEIICFKKSLGSQKFSSVVAEILKSAVNGKVAVIPMNFEIDTEVQPAHAKVTLPDQLADACRVKLNFSKGNFSSGIKREIKKCIKQNLTVPEHKLISDAKLKEEFESVLSFIENRKEQLNNNSDKNKLTLICYRRSINFLINKLSKERGDKND